MCLIAALSAMGSALGIGGATAATAAGATATAATATSLASTLSAVGTGLGIAGSLYQGYSAYKNGKAEAAALNEQAKTERQLNAVQDQRTRREYAAQMRQQAAELAARGVSLDSPTAVLLGQTAAQEMSFASQTVRSEGAATQTELSHGQRLARARATQGMFTGFTSAAGALVTGAPKIWPELLA